MATLQTQYQQWLQENPDQQLTYEQWFSKWGEINGLPIISDDFQIGPNGAYEHVGNELDIQYQDLLQHILDNGVEKKDRTGTGTLSVFGYQIRHNMKDGFPLLTTKKMAWKTMVTELLWFLRGDTNIKYLVDNDCNIWNGDAYKNYTKKMTYHPEENWLDDGIGGKTYRQLTQEEFINKIKTDDEFAKKWGELGPVYGNQWRSWYKREVRLRSDVVGEPLSLPEIFEVKIPIDQIENLINDLKTNPDSRRLMVNAWNVGELDQMVLPPCHYGFQVYTRELSIIEREQIALSIPAIAAEIEKRGPMTPLGLDRNNIPTRAISLMWNQRSVDTFLGLPFNIASYGLLLELIAKAVGMIPDELIGNLGDVHLYNNHIEQAKEQISRIPYELPKLNINTEFWPYEGGSCGEGPLDAVKVFESFKDANFCKCLLEEDIQLGNYQSHPAIKAPLSN
jgi:thymidylate synthase